MFIQQPYDSETLSRFNKNEITSLVNRYIITDYAYIVQNENLQMRSFKRSDNTELQAVYLFGLSATEEEIPPLDFPLMEETGKWICFDMRAYYTADRNNMSIAPRRSLVLGYIETRNKLTGIWCAGESYRLSILSLPYRVFGDWIGKLIASRFGLDMMEEAYISLLASIYYSRCFQETKTGDEEKEILYNYITGNYTQGMVDEVFQLSTEMHTLESFCEHVFKVTGNVRVKGFSVGVLYRLVQTSWMGNAAQQNTSIALEYPPIWIAMVYSAMLDNSFKRTTIGTTAEKLGKRGEGEKLITAVDHEITTMGG